MTGKGMKPEVFLMWLLAVQVQYYPEDEDWFFGVQTVDQLVGLLEEMIDDGDVIE